MTIYCDITTNMIAKTNIEYIVKIYRESKNKLAPRILCRYNIYRGVVYLRKTVRFSYYCYSLIIYFPIISF